MARIFMFTPPIEQPSSEGDTWKVRHSRRLRGSVRVPRPGVGDAATPCRGGTTALLRGVAIASAVVDRRRAALVRVRRGRRSGRLLERTDVHGDAHAAARIVRHARHELVPAVAIAHVVADRDFAHVADGTAAAHFALGGDALGLRRDLRRRRVLAVHLVADEAADDGARRGAAVAPAAALAELVADHAAGNGADHGARADRGAVVLARDGVLFVHAALLVPAFLPVHGDAL